MREGIIIVRFVFYTDLHLSGKVPRHRLDDFPATMVEKLREVYQIAKDRACDFVAFGGDFYNTHRVFSYDIIGDAIDIIRDSGLVTYSCIGEHDLYGHNLKTYPSSTLAFFVRCCRPFQIIQEPVELGDVVLYAKHEPDAIADAMKQEVDPSKYNILVCHELITNQRPMFDIISTSSLKNCPFDLVVSGDLHDGYETHEANGTWFVNPGSLARRTTADAHRWPQVAIIEVDKGIPPVVEIQRLKCAKSGDEVLGESIAEVARKREEFDGDTFTEEMLQFEAESVDVHDLIQKVGKSKGLRDVVLDYLATKRETA